MLTILGAHPLDTDNAGNIKARIGTIFPRTNVLVTLPGIHATQRMAYVDYLNEKRQKSGLSKLDEDEQIAEWRDSVDLIMEKDRIYIRPDPEDMVIAFEADELLQEFVSKQKIKFLNARNQSVRGAIKRRGEYWRISPVPQSPDEMKAMIAASRIAIGGKEIYYYNKSTGTRFLTYQEFSRLGDLPEPELKAHLREIREHSAHENRLGNPEIDFFMAEGLFTSADLAPHDFMPLSSKELDTVYTLLKDKLWRAVRPEYREDNMDNLEWRKCMFAALIAQAEEVVTEESLLGLSTEFFMQIEWLPGGRFEEGELIFDSIFEEYSRTPGDPELAKLCDEKLRGFIFNFIREYGDLQYVNVGRVIGSLSLRQRMRGRRDVYFAEIKQLDVDREIVKIIRMQKWGVRERLDVGKSLLDAIIQSEEYTEYILDRRLGCRQLGMNLPTKITARKVTERYMGTKREHVGSLIWSPYFERDYLYGIATDKLPVHKLENEEYALRLGRLLGRAAAPNLIVGRADVDGPLIFDDGDEIVVEDAQGLPAEIVVADHTGAFVEYFKDLQVFAPEYAGPVNRRLKHLRNPQAFAQAYLSGFLERFTKIQQEYHKRRRAFDTLFKHLPWDQAGSFAYRWELVLRRLDRTDPREVVQIIKSRLQV
jgi:hypothetical protein